MPSARIPPLVAALGLALLASLPAAARADVVVHDGGVSRDREAATWVKERTGQAPTRVLDPDDVLKGPTRLLAGGGSVERCEGRPVVIDAESRLDQITDRVLSFDLESALEAMGVLDTLLPCSDKPVQARELARLAFLRGATRFDMGDEQAAAESMLEAAVFDIEYPGELGFPGDHVELLKVMREDAAELPVSKLYVWTPAGTNEILVDGVPTEQIRKQGLGLRQGLHLLQIVQSEGLTGMWIRLEGGPATLVFPNAGRRLWADGGRSPGGELAMGLLLQEVFQGKEGDLHLIHYRAREPMAATFPAGGAARVPWENSEAPRSSRAGSQDDRGPGRRPQRGEPKPDPIDDGDGGEQTAGGGEPEDGGQPEDGGEPEDGGQPADGGEPEDDGQPADGGEPEDDVQPADGGEPADDGQTADVAEPDDGEPVDDGEPADDGSPADGQTTDSQAGGDPTTGLGATAGGLSGPDKPKQRRFRLALTFGYQYAHPFSYGMLGVDVTVGIWGPIQAGLFVRPSYGGNRQFPGMPEVMGPVMFVPMGVALGVRRPGWLSPFISGAFQFAYNRDGLRAHPFLGGAVVQGGLDIAPGDGFFMIRIQGEAGFIGQMFNARIGAGVGARF